jgi:hypothetical protein
LPTDETPRPGGYIRVYRTWRAGDEVRLRLPMPIRLVESHPRVTENWGRWAITRGPLVYCVEQADHAGVDLDALQIRRGRNSFRTRYPRDSERASVWSPMRSCAATTRCGSPGCTGQSPRITSRNIRPRGSRPFRTTSGPTGKPGRCGSGCPTSTDSPKFERLRGQPPNCPFLPYGAAGLNRFSYLMARF